MFFIVLMNIVRAWYNLILWPTIINPYTYILLILWIGLVASITYVFLYLKDQYRMQYMYRCVAVAILESAGYGMFFATLTIGLCNQALFFAAESKFFTPYKNKILNMMNHVSGQAAISQTFEQRILTILFLIFSFLLALHLITPCSYQLQDHKNYQRYAGLIFIGSVVCYGMCMLLGYL